MQTKAKDPVAAIAADVANGLPSAASGSSTDAAHKPPGLAEITRLGEQAAAARVSLVRGNDAAASATLAAAVNHADGVTAALINAVCEQQKQIEELTARFAVYGDVILTNKAETQQLLSQMKAVSSAVSSLFEAMRVR